VTELQACAEALRRAHSGRCPATTV